MCSEWWDFISILFALHCNRTDCLESITLSSSPVLWSISRWNNSKLTDTYCILFLNIKLICSLTNTHIHAQSDSIRFKTQLLFTKSTFLAVHHQNSVLKGKFFVPTLFMWIPLCSSYSYFYEYVMLLCFCKAKNKLHDVSDVQP